MLTHSNSLRLTAPSLRSQKNALARPQTKLNKPSPESLDPKDTFEAFPVMKTILMGATAAAGFLGGTGTAQAAQTAPASISIEQQTRQDLETFDLKGYLADAETDPKLQAPPETSSDSTKTAKKKAKWSGSVSEINDSLKWGKGVLEDHEKTPGEKYSDDDGWTAELSFDLTKTQGDQQWVLAGRHAMLTQQGAWVQAPDYQGFRTDLGEIALQKNLRVELNDRANLTYGFGGGLQATGNLGGRELQEWFHKKGGFGGRVGDDLQGNYTTNGLEFAPILTGGAGISYDLNSSGSLKALGQVQGTLALGPGFSNLRSEAGLEYAPFPRLSLESGVKLDASYANSRGMAFYDTNGVRPGAYAQVNLETLKGISFFTRFEDGGFRNEPVFSVGFKIGIGSKPWLNPVGNSH